MSDCYIETKNKSQLMKALRACPFGMFSHIVAKHSSGETHFRVRPVPNELEHQFEARLSGMIRNVKRMPAHVWQ
jgi:hypothetical protein